MNSSVSRSSGLDFLKVLCAFLVICRHEVFSWQQSFFPVTHAAVPVFFMLNGYFYSQTLQRGKTRSQIKRTLKLLLWALFFYTAFGFISAYVTLSMPFSLPLFLQFSFSRFLYMLTDKNAWFLLLVFNHFSFDGEHLWYLFSLLYVLCFLHLYSKKLHISKLYCLIPLLFLLQMLMHYFPPLLFGNRMDRSPAFLHPALAYFLLGHLFYNCREKRTLPFGIYLLALLTSIVLIFFIPVDCNWLWLLSVCFLACSLFSLATQDLPFFRSRFALRIAHIGRAYSADIYIYHLFLSRLLMMLLPQLYTAFPGLERFYAAVSPFTTLLLSILFAALLAKLRRYKKSRTARVLID